MKQYTNVINGIEKGTYTDMKDVIREILTETGQVGKLLELYGERDYERVVLRGMEVMLSMGQLQSGEIIINENMKIIVKQHNKQPSN